ncbi:NAD(P)H-dependent oxidoreductase [Caballeronia sordidicola]|uniref:NAD(P)H-dependent oxidoreductase n=1 Tax=Caballeronia sordidicola TaxID=196367 RepID=UPI003AF31AEE
MVEIGVRLFANDDLEADKPASWKVVRAPVPGADTALFVTREYNRSVPAVLRNAVDVLSRPYDNGALTRKPAPVCHRFAGTPMGFWR